MCQSCGNPWNFGKYRSKIQNTYKASTIQKIKRRVSKSPNGGCELQKDILKRYKKCPSALMMLCLLCKKSTSIPIPLPPKPEKETDCSHSSNTLPERLPNQKKQNEQKKKKKKPKQKTAGLKIPSVPNPSLKNKTTNANVPVKTPSQVKSNSNTTSKKKSTFSKAQMKAIAQSLNKDQPKSSLQAFLNSVR